MRLYLWAAQLFGLNAAGSGVLWYLTGIKELGVVCLGSAILWAIYYHRWNKRQA